MHLSASAFEMLIKAVKESLPTEKQQMEDAWDDGQESIECYGGRVISTFTDYHTKTYQDEK